MKAIAVASLFFLLLVISIMPVHASVTLEAVVDEGIRVSLNIELVNSTIYNESKLNNETFNLVNIRSIVLENLERQNLTRVEWSSNQNIIFDDSTNLIRVEFNLGGPDIVDLTFNKTTMARIYSVRTEWRRFHLNLTEDFSLNFTEYFGTPVAQWNYSDSQKTYYYDYTELNSFGASCKIVLPTRATHVQAIEDTIIFEVPPIIEDVLLNSPLLVLGAIIVVILISVVYRRARK